jgi:L-threonylcarbamoyladenylate synthase
MAAEIIRIDPASPDEAFGRCREIIRAGGVIAYPTDTFYGLGVDPANPAAVRRLFAVKSRKPDRPILLLIRDASAVREWAADAPPLARKFMERFWPGPLTLVFTARPGVSGELTAGTGTIGLRVPGNELTRRLLDSVGTALTGTSANIAGGGEPRTAAEAAQALGADIDLVLDGGTTAGGMPSTVLDVTTAVPRVLREGAVGIAELRGLAAGTVARSQDRPEDRGEASKRGRER